ncbi:hypothetical protein FB107DRAFT_257585 [Schizophyllum commune]
MVIRSFTLPLVLLLCQSLGALAAIDPDSALASIIGTYNVTFALVAVPSDVAYSLIPEGYSILPPAAKQFPGIGEDDLPIFIELGREANAGPPLLNFENFQEAKIEVPNVARLNDSSPFLYKRWIAVDNTLDVIGSWVQFGLNTSKEEFNPTNSSNATSFDYSIVDAVDGTFTPIEGETTWPLRTFQAVGGQPWYVRGVPHLRSTLLRRVVRSGHVLVGSVTLHPPYAGPNATEPATFAAQAIHGIFGFKIVGPLICKQFV